ncbi:hypothetical protein A2994_02525 [candidate division Kazan bacterium RIFCSPLOWO2_01_FULL_48_13]|uniref:Phosphoribosyltransferase domain-containing protein n=1 Tax=candidate division Kazan bacterium RIFCSPLOWO2_01_FULL_48_13 TaxID=1798539 RepID=A0A1F4PMV0_UNCK3|nr:MAG: hypothetical protein A2994_02525 [candidate division Kazan bacterium RIFCSPLOWO2_01_FULL_48_13]
MIFKDRQYAGSLLVKKLRGYQGTNAVVLGLARGGVVVAKTVAEALKLSFDVIVVKKVTSPYSSEFAIGALAPDGVRVIHWPSAHRVGVDEDYLNRQERILSEHIRQKLIAYRKGRKPLQVKEKTVIVIDDGVATGATLEAAIAWLKKKKAKKIVAAVPLAPPETVAKLKPEVDELVVLTTPENLNAVGQFYKEFPQVEDSQVIALVAGRGT